MPTLKAEDVQRLTRGGAAVLVVMVGVTEPLKTGYTNGFKCGVCLDALQASAFGRDQVAGGGIPLCTRCGIALATFKAEQGSLEGVFTSPDAEAAIKSGEAGKAGEQIEMLRKVSRYPD